MISGSQGYPFTAPSMRVPLLLYDVPFTFVASAPVGLPASECDAAGGVTPGTRSSKLWKLRAFAIGRAFTRCCVSFVFTSTRLGFSAAVWQSLLTDTVSRHP